MYIDRILLIVLIRFMKIEIILFTYNTYVHLRFNMLLILLILLTIAHQVQIDDVEVHLAVLEVSLQLNFQFLLQNTAHTLPIFFEYCHDKTYYNTKVDLVHWILHEELMDTTVHHSPERIEQQVSTAFASTCFIVQGFRTRPNTRSILIPLHHITTPHSPHTECPQAVSSGSCSNCSTLVI